MALTAGQRVGLYEVIGPIGAGGMGEVYRARDTRLGRDVALKILPDAFATDPERLARFEREARTASALNHPNICTIYAIDEVEGQRFIAMELLEGRSLQEVIGGRPMPIDRVLSYGVQIADALDAAHSQGILHRDIKPENILLHDGRAMVMDFGIALAVSAAAGGRMTETGLSLGTPHYMSPEQATAEKEISARSDVYSLASVLFEMLAGEPPHSGGSAQAIIMKIIPNSAVAVSTTSMSIRPAPMIMAV